MVYRVSFSEQPSRNSYIGFASSNQGFLEIISITMNLITIINLCLPLEDVNAKIHVSQRLVIYHKSDFNQISQEVIEICSVYFPIDLYLFWGPLFLDANFALCCNYKHIGFSMNFSCKLAFGNVAQMEIGFFTNSSCRLVSPKVINSVYFCKSIFLFGLNTGLPG